MKFELAGKTFTLVELLQLLEEAVDSHIYWQLSEEYYRNNGYVHGDGSSVPLMAKMIAVYQDLHQQLIDQQHPLRDSRMIEEIRTIILKKFWPEHDCSDHKEPYFAKHLSDGPHFKCGICDHFVQG